LLHRFETSGLEGPQAGATKANAIRPPGREEKIKIQPTHSQN